MTRALLAAAVLAGCTQTPVGVGGEPVSTRAATPAGTTSAMGGALRKTHPWPLRAVSRSRASSPVRDRVPTASRSRMATADPTFETGSHLTSTAYCETGLMANGTRTHPGAVAANSWPLGTRLHVSDSPYGPGTFTVEDRYGWGTSLDFAVPGDCARARAWGRRGVRVEVAR